MADTLYTTRVKIWRYPGKAGWYFVSLPKMMSASITKRFGVWKRGWGSLPVIVTVGKTTWKTSIFPESKTKTYLLPMKASVRKKESIDDSDTVKITIEIDVRSPKLDRAYE